MRFWALNFRVHDIRELLPRLLEAGATGSGQAKNWSITDAVEVWDSISTDPDGVHLDIYSYERGAELRGGELAGDISPLQTIAMCVHNVAETRLFDEGLGFEVLWERTIAGLEDMLQIPAEITLHDANLVRDPAILPGRVELFQFLDTGVVPLPEPSPLTHRAVPPARGILSVSMETPDLDEASRLVAGLGGTTIAGPVVVDIPVPNQPSWQPSSAPKASAWRSTNLVEWMLGCPVNQRDEPGGQEIVRQSCVAIRPASSRIVNGTPSDLETSCRASIARPVLMIRRAVLVRDRHELYL